ncbi:Dynein heavy chain domain-2, partial [Trinorchestia longiramus]
QEQSFLKALHNLQSEANAIVGIYNDVHSCPMTNLRLISKTRDTLSHLQANQNILFTSMHHQRYIGEMETLAELLTSMLALLSELSRVEELVSKWSPFFHANDVRFKLVNATTHFDDCNEKWKQII